YSSPIESAKISIHSSDSDTVDLTVEGYDGSSWYTLKNYRDYHIHNPILDQSFSRSYEKIKVRYFDYEHNDTIYYNYEFGLGGGGANIIDTRVDKDYKIEWSNTKTKWFDDRNDHSGNVIDTKVVDQDYKIRWTSSTTKTKWFEDKSDIPGGSGGTKTALSEGWESGTNGWSNHGGNPDGHEHSGSRGLQLRGREEIYREIDLSGYSDMTISYWEKGWSFDGPANYCESARLDFYDGNSWHNELKNEHRDYFGWHKETYDIPDSWLDSHNKIRFYFEDHGCDGCCGGDHWVIDDVKVTGRKGAKIVDTRVDKDYKIKWTSSTTKTKWFEDKSDIPGGSGGTKSGESNHTKSTLEDTYSYNSPIKSVKITLHDSDSDTVDLTVEGYDGSGWHTLKDYRNRSYSNPVLDQSFSQSYEKIKVKYFDWEHNDTIYYNYEFGLGGGANIIDTRVYKDYKIKWSESDWFDDRNDHRGSVIDKKVTDYRYKIEWYTHPSKWFDDRNDHSGKVIDKRVEDRKYKAEWYTKESKWFDDRNDHSGKVVGKKVEDRSYKIEWYTQESGWFDDRSDHRGKVVDSRIVDWTYHSAEYNSLGPFKSKREDIQKDPDARLRDWKVEATWEVKKDRTGWFDKKDTHRGSVVDKKVEDYLHQVETWSTSYQWKDSKPSHDGKTGNKFWAYEFYWEKYNGKDSWVGPGKHQYWNEIDPDGDDSDYTWYEYDKGDYELHYIEEVVDTRPAAKDYKIRWYTQKSGWFDDKSDASDVGESGGTRTLLSEGWEDGDSNGWNT
ncbi:hypothetical protein AKJ61_04695, partial [candidate division MSBL1 archaeon SCGC-AAA259B11]